MFVAIHNMVINQGINAGGDVSIAGSASFADNTIGITEDLISSMLHQVREE
jgi:hypothetical protein